MSGDFDLTMDELRVVARYVVRHAEDVLSVFEQAVPDDPRPRAAIDAAWTFINGANRTIVQQGPGSLARSGLERREPHMRTLHDSPPPPNPNRRSDTQLAYCRRVFRAETLRCMVMKPFVFQHAQDVWPEDETLLHVSLTPHDQDRELAALVARCRFAFRMSFSH